MKKILPIFALFFMNITFSQNVMKLKEASIKYKKDSLQNVYFDRVLTDEIIEVFETSTDFFVREWRTFTQAYGKFLHENHFNFGKKMKAQIEVYFNKNEKIDLFFIELSDTTFPESEYKKLLNLTKEFAKTYKFTLDASKPFTNSGTVTFAN